MSRAKVVMVTGVTSGIGAAVTRAFCESGARVYLVGRNPRKVAAAARAVPTGQLAGTALADLGSADAAAQLVRRAREELTHLDVLVLAAGEYGWTQAGDAAPEGFDSQFTVNVRGPYMLIQGLLPLLAKARGQIVVVNSSIVRSPGEGVAVFKATQHALQGMVDGLRQHLNRHRIRVSSVFPGQTATPRMRAIYARRAEVYRPSKLLRPSDVAALVVAMTQLPARMEVTDVHVRSQHRY